MLTQEIFLLYECDNVVHQNLSLLLGGEFAQVDILHHHTKAVILYL